jgi:hypothetical protein
VDSTLYEEYYAYGIDCLDAWFVSAWCLRFGICKKGMMGFVCMSFSEFSAVDWFE